MTPQTVIGIAELVHRIEDLETRVKQLEGRLSGPQETPGETPEFKSELLLPEAGGLVPLLGKALLALAGAYLFRAFTTSSIAPHWIGIALATGYALLWMALATRVSAANKLTGAVYMTIAVLALGPMLWETTVSFHDLSPVGAAMVLAGFVILSLALAWRARIEAVAWLAAAGGAVLALALCLGTLHLAPFTVALLAMAAMLEAAAVREMWPGPRRVVAFAADLAVLWLIDIYGRGANVPEGYRFVPDALGWGAPAALLIIYAGGVATRTLLRKLDAGVFETLQLLAAVGLFVFAATRRPGTALLPGLILIACGALCYAVAFLRLIKESHQRNLYSYSFFGLVLILLGSVFSIPEAARPVLWSMASIGMSVLAGRAARLLSTIHSLLFLAVAGLASGFAWDTFAILLRDGMQVATTPGALAVFAAMAIACVLWREIPRTIATAMFTWVLAAWIASLAFAVLPVSAGPPWRAAIRTVLIVGAAVALALIARYRRHPELYWLVPGAMVIALGRLVLQDLPVGRPETLFISLLFYGGALLLLSKLMRGWRTA